MSPSPSEEVSETSRGGTSSPPVSQRDGNESLLACPACEAAALGDDLGPCGADILAVASIDTAKSHSRFCAASRSSGDAQRRPRGPGHGASDQQEPGGLSRTPRTGERP
jgi:hypothetical protein